MSTSHNIFVAAARDNNICLLNNTVQVHHFVAISTENNTCVFSNKADKKTDTCEYIKKH